MSRLFVLLTCLTSWAFVGLFLLLGGSWNTPLAMGVGVVYMFFPAAIAILLDLRKKRSLVALLGFPLKPNRWFLVAWLLPLALSLAAFGTALLLPDVVFDPDMKAMFVRFSHLLSPEQIGEMKQSIADLPVHPFLLGIGQALVAAITLNAVVAWGEEVGWRGFLSRELAHLGFWGSSLVTGLVWGIWHAPIIMLGHNYPQHPYIGVLMMTLFCVLLSPIIQLVRIKAKSVLAAAVFHGSINASAGLAIMVIAGGNDLLVGLTGLAGFVVLSVVDLAIFLYFRDLPKASAAVEFSPQL